MTVTTSLVWSLISPFRSGAAGETPFTARTMPKALSSLQKSTVTTMLAAKAPQRDIAKAASCSVSQIKRMAKNIRRWGKPVAPKLVPQGRPRTLAEDVVEVRLLDYDARLILFV